MYVRRKLRRLHATDVSSPPTRRLKVEEVVTLLSDLEYDSCQESPNAQLSLLECYRPNMFFQRLCVETRFPIGEQRGNWGTQVWMGSRGRAPLKRLVPLGKGETMGCVLLTSLPAPSFPAASSSFLSHSILFPFSLLSSSDLWKPHNCDSSACTLCTLFCPFWYLVICDIVNNSNHDILSTK